MACFTAYLAWNLKRPLPLFVSVRLELLIRIPVVMSRSERIESSWLIGSFRVTWSMLLLNCFYLHSLISYCRGIKPPHLFTDLFILFKQFNVSGQRNTSGVLQWSRGNSRFAVWNSSDCSSGLSECFLFL